MKRARRPVGLRRNAARIHHHHIGSRWLTLTEPRHAQPVAHRFAIRARGPATEMLHVKAERHSFSLRPLRSTRHLGHRRSGVPRPGLVRMDDPASGTWVHVRSSGILWTDHSAVAGLLVQSMQTCSKPRAFPLRLPLPRTAARGTFSASSTSPSSAILSIGLPLAVLPPYVHLRMGLQRGSPAWSSPSSTSPLS
jgi:hypothetical protein